MTTHFNSSKLKPLAIGTRGNYSQSPRYQFPYPPCFGGWSREIRVVRLPSVKTYLVTATSRCSSFPGSRESFHRKPRDGYYAMLGRSSIGSHSLQIPLFKVSLMTPQPVGAGDVSYEVWNCMFFIDDGLADPLGSHHLVIFLLLLLTVL